MGLTNPSDTIQAPLGPVSGPSNGNTFVTAPGRFAHQGNAGASARR